jgi:hypothetical protein
MRAFLVGPFAAALAVVTAPAAAAPPSPRTIATVNHDISLIATWMTRVNEALEPANAVVAATQPQLEAIWGSVHDPASARVAAARARDLLRTQRAQIAVAQSRLAAVSDVPPNGAHIPGVDIGKVLTDARALVTQLLDYTDTLIKFSDALESGDVDAVRTAVPTIIRGSLLLVDGQVTIYRNRQALFPADEAAHQITGQTTALYEAVSIAMRASFRAMLEHQPDQAAADERSALTALAARDAANTRAGRQNLARARGEVPTSLNQRAGIETAQLVAKAKIMIDAEEEMFLVGDELESWSRTEAQENEAVHARLGQSQALHRLTEMEQRLRSIQQAAASALAAGQQP